LIVKNLIISLSKLVLTWKQTFMLPAMDAMRALQSLKNSINARTRMVVSYFVNRAHTQQTSVLAHAEGVQHSREEYGLQLSLADYALDQTESQQAHLADSLGAAMKKVRVEAIEWMENETAKKTVGCYTGATISKTRKFTVPTTYNNLSHCYTQGKHSVYENIPHPPVESLDDHHSYSSPNHIVADLLSHEVEIDKRWCDEFVENVAASTEVDFVHVSGKRST
jgi:hypothetical protein